MNRQFLIILKKYRFYFFGFVLVLILFSLVFKTHRVFKRHEEKIFSQYSDYAFGIDVSHYQGAIDWTKVHDFSNGEKITFVFIRASVGKDNEDTQFKINWKVAKQKKLLRGAYHYYRPDENSIEQANNFIRIVCLEKGDLPPVLDIEKEASVQSMTKLKKGLKRWLKKIEKHYGMKPIIYTPDIYYRDFLNDTAFNQYKFWIANYNHVDKPIHNNWTFWQFTQWGKIKGINHNVDFNVFRGSCLDLKKLCKK